MSNPAKAKGSQWERDVVAYMQTRGFRWMERRFGAGQQKDKGDLTGLPGVVIECKNHKTHKFSEWLAEAEVERVNANADIGIVVAKRSRKPAGEAYVVMTLATFCTIMEDR